MSLSRSTTGFGFWSSSFSRPACVIRILSLLLRESCTKAIQQDTVMNFIYIHTYIPAYARHYYTRVRSTALQQQQQCQVRRENFLSKRARVFRFVIQECYVNGSYNTGFNRSVTSPNYSQFLLPSPCLYYEFALARDSIFLAIDF